MLYNNNNNLSTYEVWISAHFLIYYLQEKHLSSCSSTDPLGTLCLSLWSLKLMTSVVILFFNMICKISTVRKSGHMFRQQFKDEFETSRQPITVRPQHKHLHKTSKQGTVLICLRFCLIMIIFMYIFRCLPTKDAESQHLLHICLII